MPAIANFLFWKDNMDFVESLATYATHEKQGWEGVLH